ncbi:glycoside hydrolase N-terminal domain-containing protein [Paenibacillus lupini]|uniref:glycosyl hydrolase family 95 catalytic domain-containing protein n=1 Tax=Paenibacillus lupini TaxID=1450204 RepID=UPI00141DAA68|nr:glycoside hydrolase N-terminal domain-containing protein [Paenibacillus lupini]NIK23803.1 hypothetical protein [Paenibacillus lupini]
MNLHERISRHDLIYSKPAPTFFEGALLGNGGMGAVVTTRPDAVVIHFGHNNVWDIRIAEDHLDEIGDFESLFARLKEIPADFKLLSEEDWYRDYVAMTSENYNNPYPRPMPCGSLLLGFDRRRVEVLGHTLRIGNGLCEIRFLVEGHPVSVQLFVDQEADRLWIAFGETDRPDLAASLFNRIKLIPDPNTPEELPSPLGFVDDSSRRLTFRQRLPYSRREADWGAGDTRDRAFRLSVTVASSAELAGNVEGLEAKLAASDSFVVCVELEEGLDAEVSEEALTKVTPSREDFAEAFATACSSWSEYWSRSSVTLEDDFIEQVWYRNLYFFHCSVKPDATCPGLFANWSYGKIGSEWHGDYHMNYNTQQPFWLAFSSNHIDKHLAYVSMVEHVLPISRKWAKDYYGLRGAYFPHSAYPVEMNVMPYPVPHWGWEVCETPWTVQSLWWHYLYTMDRTFLEERAFVPMKEAALFMVDYMKRPDAKGEAWGDDRYHVFPTVVPELYELTPGFKKNHDCIVDLTLTKFLFLAFEKACEVLGWEEEEAVLLDEIREVLGRFPDYPTAESQRGTVFVSVPGEDPEVVYNVPNSITTVFPGEEHGLHSSPEDYEVAVNSYRNHRNEGGNELVFYHMAGARLGQLDLERFKRQINYCLLPNGTCTDKLLESGGRYSDTTPFDYMAPMGIWFENFALPAVINECLMQSYNGIIRLFPNWPPDRRASFETLRAVGGFLVSAAFENGQVQAVEIVSEAGSRLRAYNPWEGGAICRIGEREESLEGPVLELDTAKGETIRMTRA